MNFVVAEIGSFASVRLSMISLLLFPTAGILGHEISPILNFWRKIRRSARREISRYAATTAAAAASKEGLGRVIFTNGKLKG